MSVSAVELLRRFADGSLRPSEALASMRSRFEARQDAVCAFTATRWDEAMEEAFEHDRAWASGAPSGPLAGVPFAVKDLLDTASLPTTYGSRMFAGHRPVRDAAAVAAVRRAGGVLVGKTVTHEFAWGFTSVNRNGPTARNPLDPARTAGGSSGGSAAAVADGQVPLAVGTDTAGSIRVPAAFCGIAGLRPSFGLISAAGVLPLAPSLDTIGAFGATPADVALLTGAMRGRALRLGDDARAPVVGVPAGGLAAESASAAGGRTGGLAAASAGTAGPRTIGLAAGSAGARTGGLPDALGAALARAGLATTSVVLPHAQRAIDALRGIQFPEALATHRDAGLYPARRDEYGPDVLSRLDAAAAMKPAQHARALRERERLRADVADLFAASDVLALPIATIPPPRIDDLLDPTTGADEALRADLMPNTALASVLGLPSCVVPVGLSPEGLPIAVQLIGPLGADALVLRTAQAVADTTSA